MATNIAETSITIDGIVHVIDCGFSKQKFASPSGDEMLVIAPISQSSARQRAGRAGRSRPGTYYCLMTEQTYSGLPQRTPPEMQRCNLASTVLQLKALGVENVLRFDYLSPLPPAPRRCAREPPPSRRARPHRRAHLPHGESMSLFLEPGVACFLLNASAEGCESDALTLAAMLTPVAVRVAQQANQAACGVCRRKERDHTAQRVAAMRASRGRAAREGEHVVQDAFLNERVLQRVAGPSAAREAPGCLRAAEAAQAAQAAQAYRRRRWRWRRCYGTDRLRRALVRGFFATAAQHEGGGLYRSVLRGSSLKLHGMSVLQEDPPDWLIIHETTYSTSIELITSATAVEMAWLSELAPHFFELKSTMGMASQGPGGSNTTVTMGHVARAKRPRDDKEGAAAADQKATERGRGAIPAVGGSTSVAALLGESLFGGGKSGAMF